MSEKSYPIFLNKVLEASMRTDDSDLIYSSLKEFIAVKANPEKRLQTKLREINNIPDRIHEILKSNFGFSRKMSE
jgi:hypothetical protein